VALISGGAAKFITVRNGRQSRKWGANQMIGRRARTALFVMAGTGLWLALFAATGRASDALPPTPLALFNGGTLPLRSLAGRVIVIRFAASW
jgi:hypothetical protein